VLLVLLLLEILEPLLLGHQQLLLLFNLLLLARSHIPQLVNAQLVGVTVHSQLVWRPLLHAAPAADLFIVLLLLLWLRSWPLSSDSWPVWVGPEKLSGLKVSGIRSRINREYTGNGQYNCFSFTFLGTGTGNEQCHLSFDENKYLNC
jgi:hypothetical protein